MNRDQPATHTSHYAASIFSFPDKSSDLLERENTLRKKPMQIHLHRGPKASGKASSSRRCRPHQVQRTPAAKNGKGPQEMRSSCS
jgi:hypothetical protein